jgi:hypothetical protein
MQLFYILFFMQPGYGVHGAKEENIFMIFFNASIGK